MDRFIGVAGYEKEYLIKNLKSNMDRFIGHFIIRTALAQKDLKSNMDRFIVFNGSKSSRTKLFKIQYG